MKPIQLFYLRDCPFCKKAFRYIENLKKQAIYKPIEIELIEESEQVEFADQFDYYFVPSFYIDGVKIHEGGIFENEVEEILKKALE